MIPTQHTVDTPYMVGPVHLYTLELESSLVLIDTGPPTETGRAFLRENIDLRRLTHVLVTHGHIDHYGQAGWLAENSDAVVYLPRLDIIKHAHHAERMWELSALIGELGFGASFAELLCDRFASSMMPLFPKHCRVAEDLPSELGIEVIGCPGHSQSDLVYAGHGWAVTGDILLRGVFQSPLLDVDLEKGGRFRNYDAYCGSIVRLAGLEQKKILPGHRTNVPSVAETILFYVSKMLQRLRLLVPHLSKNTVAGVIRNVFPTMSDPFHIYLKSSEVLFMKDLLEDPGRLASALQCIGLYETVAEAFEIVLEQGARLRN